MAHSFCPPPVHVRGASETFCAWIFISTSSGRILKQRQPFESWGSKGQTKKKSLRELIYSLPNNVHVSVVTQNNWKKFDSDRIFKISFLHMFLCNFRDFFLSEPLLCVAYVRYSSYCAT